MLRWSKNKVDFNRHTPTLLLFSGGHFGETSRSLRLRLHTARRVLDPDSCTLCRWLVSMHVFLILSSFTIYIYLMSVLFRIAAWTRNECKTWKPCSLNIWNRNYFYIRIQNSPALSTQPISSTAPASAFATILDQPTHNVYIDAC